FKVHERIAKDDDLIVLTDELAEPEQQTLRRAAERAGELAAKEAFVKEGIDVKAGVEGLAGELSGHAAVVSTEEMVPALEAELRRVLSVTMEEMVPKFVDRMTPVLSTFVEDYTRRVLYEIAEKVIREEIDKLLKESAS
ncbi:MAG TPA: hypothetical protein VLX12_00645, partial [Syntrophorhabdales bacterium]|nr:hypothetical protein [Syntrophorhabdales bacterium]